MFKESFGGKCILNFNIYINVILLIMGIFFVFYFILIYIGM